MKMRSEHRKFYKDSRSRVKEHREKKLRIQTPMTVKRSHKISSGLKTIALILLMSVVALTLFSCGGDTAKRDNVAFFLKDNEIYFKDLSLEGGMQQLSSNLIGDASEDELLVLADTLSLYTYVSNDGKYVFFPDLIDFDQEGFGIFCQELDNPESKPIKIDSEIQYYTVNDSSDTVTYLKSDEQNLYQYDIENNKSTKIASNIDKMKISADGKKLIYSDKDGNIYAKYEDAENEKITSKAEDTYFVSADYSTVYYLKNDAIYKYIKDKSNEKIIDGVYGIISVYETGQIYYLTTRKLIEFVIDDVSDDPYISPDGTNSYYEKIMEKLRAEEATEGPYNLYFYNGETSTLITDSFSDFIGLSENSGYIAYNNFIMKNFQKIPLSTISSASQPIDKLREFTTYDERRTACLTYQGNQTELTAKVKIENVIFDKSGKTVYYTDSLDYDLQCEIYKITVNEDGQLSEAELFDKKVYTENIQIINGDRLLYYKSVDIDGASLYIDGKLIDEYVTLGGATAFFEDTDVYYLTFWDNTKMSGTLKVYNGEEVIKISDNVMRCVVSKSKRALYLADYSLKYYCGSLYEWYDGESRKLQEDVTYIFSFESGEVFSELFN